MRAKKTIATDNNSSAVAIRCVFARARYLYDERTAAANVHCRAKVWVHQPFFIQIVVFRSDGKHTFELSNQMKFCRLVMYNMNNKILNFHKNIPTFFQNICIFARSIFIFIQNIQFLGQFEFKLNYFGK